MVYAAKWKEASLNYGWGCQRNGNELLTPEGSKDEGLDGVFSKASKNFVSDSSVTQIPPQGDRGNVQHNEEDIGNNTFA